MNRLLFKILAVVTLALALGSCNEFEMLEHRSGYLSVSLQRDDEVFTRSVVSPDKDQIFALTICNQDGRPVAQVPDHRTLEVEPISLAAGIYNIIAVSGTDAEATWDSPLYKGETQVKILADQNNSANIVCTLANVMVTVDFSDDFENNFEEYSLTVDNGVEALVFSNTAGTLGKKGYFRVTGKLNWRFALTNSDGALYERSGSYSDVKAQQHYAMKFTLVDDSVSDNTGAAGFKVIVDDSENPPVEYPVVLDFTATSYPSVEPNEGFDISGETPISAGDRSPKILVATAASGFSSLVIRQGVENDYDIWYQLVEASDATISEMAGIGISASSVAYGDISTTIDITEYVSRLKMGSYHIEVLVYDLKGHMTKSDIIVNVLSDVSADPVSAVPDTDSAVITAKWYDAVQPSGLGLEYRKKGAADWIKVPQSDITFNASDKTFYAEITGLEEASEYEFRPYSDRDSDLRTMIFTTLSGLQTLEAIPWARFAIITGGWNGDRPDGLGFEYRVAGSSDWQQVDPSTIIYNSSAKTYEGEIRGLEPETDYEYRAVSSSAGAVRSFTTQTAGTIYNLSFDDWYQDGKVWYPFAKGGEHTWDSANEGAATFIGSSTTPVEGSDAVKGKAARLESKNAVIAFAAGNLYTGDFGKVSGVGAELDWGVAFSSRPIALKGYYKYLPKAIDKTGSGMNSYKGTMDKAQIQIFLTDWSAPFRVNTKESEFVDFNADYVIAYGKLESDTRYEAYEEFTIPLEYRSLTKKPTHIVISVAASYLGDYFTGGVGSTMYVDEFSLVYDPDELTETERETVNYR